MLNIPAEELEPIVVDTQLAAGPPKANIFVQGLQVQG
jgi:hypothetical protein